MNWIIDFILQHGLYLTVLILILVCLGIGLTYLSDWFRDITRTVVKSKSKYLDKSILEVIQFLVQIIFSVSILVIIILVSSYAYPPFKKYFWDTFSIYFTPLISIIITLIIISILVQVINRFFRYLRIALKKRPDSVLKSETTRFIELSLVYIVYLIGLFIVLVIGLSTVGLSDPIWQGLVKFFRENLSPIILLIVGLVIIYALSKFITAFINDLKTESTRYNPNTLELTRNIVNYILLVIALFMILFSIFHFMGLSEVSETLLIVIVVVVGFILAMSASGALGNFFSGLVLMFTSPFEHGDTVKIGNGIIGKVQTKALFSTKITSEDGEEIKLPNSRLLDSQIINYSSARLLPITINVNVDYTIPSEKVHSLLLTAATNTDGISTEKDAMPEVYTVSFEAESIKYRLRVFIDNLQERENINSKLHGNIQKSFKDAEVAFKGNNNG